MNRVLGCYQPTKLLRWRTLPLEPGKAQQRSILEQLWVNDDMTEGEWRPVPRVAEDAEAGVTAEQLRELF